MERWKRGQNLHWENRLQFLPAVFSHDGQIDAVYKRLVQEQILKLICFEGQAKQSKVRSVMKWWYLAFLSLVSITTTAIKNVAIEAFGMSDLPILTTLGRVINERVEGRGIG